MTQWEKFDDIKKEWLKDDDFKKSYDDLEIEFKIALELIKARKASGLTQGEVAARMHTTQSVIARLESGRAMPTLETLSKYAQATGNKLNVRIQKA